jgi:DNA-binding GntR family transcriptional regulator
MAGVPKYIEIKEKLEARILAGEFPVVRPGEFPDEAKLPTEDTLAGEYQSSKMTVKRALDELTQDGVLVRKSGLGTWAIRRPGARAKAATIMSLSDQIREAGLDPVTEVCDARRLPASEVDGWIWAAFELDPEGAAITDLYLIDRMRKARAPDGSLTTLARQTLYLFAAQFPDDLLQGDLTGSIFELYARHGGRQPAEAEETITFRPATAEEAALLGLEGTGECECPPYVVVRRRITLDQHRMVLEVMNSVDRADWFGTYTYRLTMARRDEGGG